MTDYNEMLMGSGGRSAKFEDVGDSITGFVTRIETRQRTDMKTAAPLTWPDGNPRMQLVVTLDTELQEDDDDDGLRNLYVPIPSALQKAIAEAVRKSGERGLADRGQLYVKHTAVDAPTQKGFNGAKQYTAKYKAPEVVLFDHDPGIEDEDAPF